MFLTEMRIGEIGAITHDSYRKIPFFGEAEEILLSQKAKVYKLKEESGKRFRSEGEFDDLIFVTKIG